MNSTAWTPFSVSQQATCRMLGAAVTSLLLAASSAASAAWVLVDNFDSYDNTTVKTIGSNGGGDVTGGNWYGVFNGTGAATVENDATPDSPTDNALQAFGIPGQGAGGWRGAQTNLAANFDTDFTLGDNSVNTLFYQFKAVSGTGNYDTMFGLTDSTANLDNNNSWQDFAVMPFLAGGGAGAADFQASTATGTGVAIADVAGDTWYNVWLVIDTNTNLYDVYTSTGSDPGVLGINDAVFRNGLGTNALAAFGFAQQQAGVVQIDNLYLAQGDLTTNPLAIPEPTSALLVALALGGAALVRGRQSA
jgi:hypothetical protein